jgi:hypothetical protein
MYFFYFDESGSRDPSIGTPEHPKSHIYVLLTVGIFEGQWHRFENSVSGAKLELSKKLTRGGKGKFDLAACEVKSNWIRNSKERAQKSLFLHSLDDADRESLVSTYFQQLPARNMVIMAAVIDKRHLQDHMTHETLHKKAYEFLLERIEHYMNENHPKHQALIVMDDTSKELNQAVAMKHAYFQREGNQNMRFRHIVEYPFFTRSELSDGVQLADLLAYNVYRVFSSVNFDYPYFQEMLGSFYSRKESPKLDGLKVWPTESPLVVKSEAMWDSYKKKSPLEKEAL